MRPWTVGIAVVAMVAASCGDDGSVESPVAADAPAATTDASVVTTCTELLDVLFAINQEFINVFGAGPVEDWYAPAGGQYPPDMRAAEKGWSEKLATFNQQVNSLGGCEDVAAQSTQCQSHIDPLGDAGLVFTYDNVPCELDPAAETRANDLKDSFADSRP